ncbi:hypothetical protein KAR91_72080 [Candidatus Pacearchaeota archaeon]|nr:hypothetical protein [Candidatus Pacearchaeota archaeon]
MNKNEAFTRGTLAFYKGNPRTPMLEPSFHPFTNTGMDLSSPETQELFKQWYRGWDKANLDTEESDMAEHDAAAKAEALNEKILTHGPYRPDPIADQEEARERWLEHLGYQDELKRGIENVEGVTFNDNGSVTLSADWIKENSEKD